MSAAAVIHHIKTRLFDSHPYLPLDPDSEQKIATRLVQPELSHLAAVALGAFFGTLARFEMGLWIPGDKDGWSTATFIINIVGSFLLGVLLQALLHRGKDEGGRRILRLLLGAGFLGGFTTYSSLAVSVAVLAHNNLLSAALAYAVVTVVLGTLAAALGIQVASAGRRS
jgi:CrcB protein